MNLDHLSPCDVLFYKPGQVSVVKTLSPIVLLPCLFRIETNSSSGFLLWEIGVEYSATLEKNVVATNFNLK